MSDKKTPNKAKRAASKRVDNPQPAKKRATTGKKSDKNRRAEIIPEELLQKNERRAYELFLARGGTHGDDWKDWFQAEKELNTKTG
jgi:hypothetical protein